MNAIELLKNDHEKVSGILEKLDQTTERALKTREEQYGRLKEEIEAHSHIEETIFYPALSDDNRTRVLTLEAYEQHNLINTLIQEMDVILVDTEQWTAKFKVLKTTVDQHVEEEEKQIFPQARQVLNKARLDELGEEMEQARAQFLQKDTALAVSGRRDSEQKSQRASGGGKSRGASSGGFALSIDFACPSFSFIRRLCNTR